MSGSKSKFMGGEEKEFLKEVVTKYSHIVECKKTDAVSVTAKKRIWKAIADEFNAVAEHCNRTPEQLRKCWENMKSRRKKELSQEKIQRMATGGGSYKPPTGDDFMDDILSTVDIELKDVVDSDTLMLSADALVSARSQDRFTPDLPIFPIVEEIEIQDVEILQPTVAVTPSIASSKKKNGFSRGTAIETELAARVERTDRLRMQDEELHSLRLEEQQLRVQEARVRLAIAEECLEQEKIKTAKLQL